MAKLLVNLYGGISLNNLKEKDVCNSVILHVNNRSAYLTSLEPIEDQTQEKYDSIRANVIQDAKANGAWKSKLCHKNRLQRNACLDARKRFTKTFKKGLQFKSHLI